MKITIIYIISLFLISCAGPTSPFGASVLIQDKFEYTPTHNKYIEMSAFPERQNYISPFKLSLKILDPSFDIKNFKYEVVYNGHKLSRWLKTETIILPTKSNPYIQINFDNLALLPGSKNNIKFLYYKDSEHPIVYSFKEPNCSYPSQEITSIPNYEVDKKLLNLIKINALKYKNNPSLLAALIAQESSFNPHALSYAKALGLTQVTSIADKEIRKIKTIWQSHPEIKKLSLLEIKTRIYSKNINKKNDWRLDPNKSIEGGLIYLDYLTNYWKKEESKNILKNIFKDQIPLSDIILASYNSGAARVKREIQKNKKSWLLSSKLKEARKYVKNINSYCWNINQGQRNEK